MCQAYSLSKMNQGQIIEKEYSISNVMDEDTTNDDGIRILSNVIDETKGRTFKRNEFENLSFFQHRFRQSAGLLKI